MGLTSFCSPGSRHSRDAFFGAYSGIGKVGISQTIVRSPATLIPERL